MASAIGNRQSRVAFIFPGQASQYAGMGRDLAEKFAVAHQIFEEADAALDFPISQLCFGGSNAELELTENTQPAILTVSIAALRVMEAHGFQPDFVAGHSLGEYSALVAAGALSFTEAVRTVRARGRYMQEAVPVGTGAMAAVIGAALGDIERLCAEASQGQVCAPANVNTPGQVVIAGHVEAVDRAAELLKSAGAKRVIKLKVSAPFHSALMMPAQKRLAENLVTLSIGDLRVPLVTNVDALSITAGSQARDSLIRQVSAPVRWLESMEFLIRQGVETFIEVGPGKVLSGLMRQISREVRCLNVEDSASLSTARASLAGA